MKRLTFLAAAIVLSISFVSNCYAIGNAESYIMTVLRVELKRTDGTWVTIATPNQAIDVASVNAGAAAASLLSDVAIPVGSYNNFRLRLSETMRFSGQDGAVDFSRAGGDVTINGTDGDAASTATWGVGLPNANFTEAVESHSNIGPAGEVIARLNLDAGDADNYIEVYAANDLNTPIAVNANSVISMYFDFDTQGTITHNAAEPAPVFDVMFFLPPQAGTQFGITVDGVSIIITEAQMQIDF